VRRLYRGFEEANENVAERTEEGVDDGSTKIAVDGGGDTAEDIPPIDHDDVYREYRGASTGEDGY
jgi:hypothetical protein